MITKELLEAVLFVEGAVLTRTELCKMFECELATLEACISALKTEKQNGGVILIDDGSAIGLYTNPDLAEALHAFEKVEAETQLSKPAQETHFYNRIRRANLKIRSGLYSWGECTVYLASFAHTRADYRKEGR